MNNITEVHSCNCHNSAKRKEEKGIFLKVKKTTKSFPSIFMSILIAFFPKCPFCWAIYMSMFGSLGLARLPYMPWLLPVLFVFLAVHLFMLFRKAPQKGYMPFALSLGGALVILTGRTFFPFQEWLLISGMILIISGSLLNNFSNIHKPFINLKQNIV
jgi:mercuric ion transport protein